MIPLRDNQASRRLTLINVALILTNVAVFLHEATLGQGLSNFIYQYAMIPAHVTATLEGGRALARLPHTTAGPRALETIVTSMFLHGGLMHLVGNMLYLFIFGAAVEEAMGPVRFLFFYMLSGIAAALAMAAFMPNSTVPVIGASGAIAGVLGAYFVLYPRAKITTILPIFVLIILSRFPPLCIYSYGLSCSFMRVFPRIPRSQAGSHGGRMWAVFWSGWCSVRCLRISVGRLGAGRRKNSPQACSSDVDNETEIAKSAYK